MAGGRVQLLDDDSFDRVLRRMRGPVLVHFSASWCPPCRTIEQPLEEIAEEFRGRAHVARVDVDQSGDLTQRFGVRSVPTLILLRAGRVVDQVVGAAPLGEIRTLIGRHVD